MRHLKFVLVLVIAAADLWECVDAKWGDKGELSPRRRRCYDGSLPRRLKKKERKIAGGGGDVCSALYPRASCCPSRRGPNRTDPTVTHSHARATLTHAMHMHHACLFYAPGILVLLNA